MQNICSSPSPGHSPRIFRWMDGLSFNGLRKPLNAALALLTVRLTTWQKCHGDEADLGGGLFVHGFFCYYLGMTLLKLETAGTSRWWFFLIGSFFYGSGRFLRFHRCANVIASSSPSQMGISSQNAPNVEVKEPARNLPRVFVEAWKCHNSPVQQKIGSESKEKV